jgi:hypothetical protein
MFITENLFLIVRFIFFLNKMWKSGFVLLSNRCKSMFILICKMSSCMLSYVVYKNIRIKIKGKMCVSQFSYCRVFVIRLSDFPKVTICMEQSSSWEASSSSASQEILCISWNSKFHYRSQKAPSFFYVSWARSVQYILSHSNPPRRILIIYSHLRLGVSGDIFAPQVFSPKPCRMKLSKC